MTNSEQNNNKIQDWIMKLFLNLLHTINTQNIVNF